MAEIRKLDVSLSPHREKRLEDALKRREEIDYKCFLKLQQLLPFVEAPDHEVTGAVKEARQLILERDRANHDFVAALTGRR